MGCFNVSCALSGLSISGGDSCYFIPLIPHEYSKGAVGQGTSFISNDGAHGLFGPATLPIKGSYSDYGTLEDPVKDANTERIEKLFKTTIENFLEEPCNFTITMDVFDYIEGGKSDWKPKAVPISGCFIHEFAYDIAIKYTLESDGSFFNSFPVNNELLEWIGSNPPVKHDEIERYKDIFEVEGVDDYVIQTDGEYSHIAKVEKDGTYKDVGMCHTLEKMQEQWKELTGKDLHIPEEAKTKHRYDITFDELRDMYKQEEEARLSEVRLKKMQDEGETDEKLMEQMKTVSEFMSMQIKYSLKSRSKGRSYLDVYKPEIMDDNPLIRKMICEMTCLSSFMFNNNKLYMPNFSGPQCGEPRAELALLEKAIEFSKIKVKERDEW